MTRNKFEAKVQAHLGPSYAYESIKLSYTISHTYLPDFVDAANKQIVESKGRFTAADRQKMLAVKKQNPDWTITILFQQPNRTISKTSKTTYSGWCDKVGINWTQLP